MRVLHIVASGQRRGAEVFASALVGCLARDGVEQRVAVVRGGDREVRFDAPTAVLGGSGPLVPGVKLEIAAVGKLRRAVARFRPDVVQAHGGEALKYAMAAASGNGRRIVYRRIGDSLQFRGSPLRVRAYGGLMKRSARVVAVAETLRTELVERFGLAPSQVVTIPNGVDLSVAEPSRPRTEIRDALGISQDAQVVLSLGALTWEKDPLGHIQIVGCAAAERPRLVHVLAGDGPMRAELQAEVDRRGVQDRTLVLGSRDDVADLLAASDVMLLASRTEGMPASVIEAGAAGIPVVGYALSGVPDVVVDGESGSLVRAGDARALSRALAELLDDEGERTRMGRLARERCRARFDIRAVAPRYLRLYQDVSLTA